MFYIGNQLLLLQVGASADTPSIKKIDNKRTTHSLLVIFLQISVVAINKLPVL